ncbi:recombinase family protein [Brachybacterium sp. MASK1Z-5]|uniref:Recombinase family protein n=1 Tax=Brachybacterium halotolerans TaxID=2795215 RepID=A0ABS1BBT7_9MICO|nr:recombinase family protein [Brachybacterium halotolerans]MBK0332054.1 recombinase family protein [Brachybacterium halotolerans]
MIFGYTRTTTRDKQHEALQRDALKTAGVSEGQIYSDQISGARKTASRAGWSALEGQLRAGDELVVWRIDRIGRSMIDVITSVDELLERGVIVRSLSDGIDPSTSEGRLMLKLMAVLAEYERELIRESVNAGVDAARARGVKFGRPAPDPEEAARKVRVVQYLVREEGFTVAKAAAEVGWSRATYYRHKGSHHLV